MQQRTIEMKIGTVIRSCPTLIAGTVFRNDQYTVEFPGIRCCHRPNALSTLIFSEP